MSVKSSSRSRWITQIGPGIAIAATGVGAADLVTSTVAGARFGTTLAWAIVVGAVLKLALNEGVARWHVATGRSVLQGWSHHLGRPALAIFLIYLLVWSMVVCGGLIVGSGLAANSVAPFLSRQRWGVIQAVLAFLLVWFGSYDRFEKWMKLMIGVMFVAIVGCAVVTSFSVAEPLQWQGFPEGSLPLTLALAGGVGGSVTMLVYGYWIKERQWESADSLPLIRLDLSVAYGVTGVLALGAMLLASQTLLPKGITVEGSKGLIEMASMLRGNLGMVGQWIFLVGFWGATFSSLLGVLQGVPYLFADLIHCWNQPSTDDAPEFDYAGAAKTKPYRLYLAYLAIPSTLFLFYDRPIWLMVLYAAVSALFIPILATALLLMNNLWVQSEFRNGWKSNLTLFVALMMFVLIALQKVIEFGAK